MSWSDATGCLVFCFAEGCLSMQPAVLPVPGKKYKTPVVKAVPVYKKVRGFGLQSFPPAASLRIVSAKLRNSLNHVEGTTTRVFRLPVMI